MDKRFIEESFPVKEVSKESSREKRIRHSHISTLHLWWARRPLASSRATNYAALISEASDDIDWVKKRNFIIELSKWENSLNKNIIEKARKEIFDANNGVPPRILDPFSGGGAIPLECLRLGCETYANDYNPIATLIEKCTLEYPQKYGKFKDKSWSESSNRLVIDLEKWGNLVLDKVRKEISQFYPQEKDGSIKIGHIWAKEIKCQNPSCNAKIPLMRQFWLAKSKNKKISLFPYVSNSKVMFKILDLNKDFPEDFNPSKGTVSRANVECPVCKTTVDAKTTRKLFKEGNSHERLISIVYSHPDKNGKYYRIADESDMQTFTDSIKYLEKKRKNLFEMWGMDPVPDEILPLMSGTFNVPLYGMTKWGDLFNERQKLSLIVFMEAIRDIWVNNEIGDENYRKVIISYLALALDKMSSFNTRNGFWLSNGEKGTQIFSRNAIPMLWDYVETNPFAQSFAWQTQIKWISKTILHLSNITEPAKITNYSATNMPYQDNYFDAIFTDPPYYNSVPYADLSDFYYVILKRILGDIYPELFSTPLTPKKEEITEMSGWDKSRYSYKDQNFFEKKIKDALDEIYRLLKPNGIATIVYAHKTTEGWETIINAIIDSGLTVTASWPISTEMQVRLRARNSAVLASSIYIVARKVKKQEIGWLKDIKEEIREYIPKKLNKLWDEGILGADFFIAAIGSAIEVFGKYDKILNNKGEEVRADYLLYFIRNVVTDYAVKHILHNGIADELSPLTKFYLLWRWNYQETQIPFDEARKLAQSAGIDLTEEWKKGFIVKRGEFIAVLGPDKRDLKSLEDSKELIDILHFVCISWKEGKKVKMKKIIKESAYGEGEALFKVAQAISETLPNKSSEKKMIEGFLTSRDRILQDIREDESQTKLV